MKNLFFISSLFSILSSLFPPETHQGEKQRNWNKISADPAIDWKQSFQFELNRVYPQGGQDLSRFNPEVSSLLPTRSLKVPPSLFRPGLFPSLRWRRGDEFDGVMKDQSLKIEPKEKKILIYRFLSPPKTIHTRFPWKFQEVGIAQ